ncbi:MAG: double-strand break repair helicase AddA [Micavibrio sp.]|nr:MAG: double-strand break repair helicase AddA [Micavibrio sp.]
MVQEALKTTPDQTSVRDLDPNIRQRKASEPGDSVWVSASAGTGKTKVLTDRVLRLLLPRSDGAPGTPPHKILCLTFTKAGASEMALRINDTLGTWAVLPPKELEALLTKLLGKEASNTEIKVARKLFAQVVDTPGGLKIMTIHSFCQSVLGRFPLEAELSPHFSVLEESQARLLLSQARDQVLGNAEAGSPLMEALERVAGQVNEEQFLQLLGDFVKERYQLARQRWGSDALYTAICTALDIQAGQEPDDLIRETCESSSFDEGDLRRACSALAEGTDKTDKPKAQALQQWLDQDIEGRIRGFQDYLLVYFKLDGNLRKTMATKSVLKIMPDCSDVMDREAARLKHIQEQLKSGQCAAFTRDLFLLGQEIIKVYQGLKESIGGLDFDDLITRTLDLFEGRTTRLKDADIVPWVMYKLDQGLDHILIDEAQDTNPEQWKIIAAICEEFFSGLGAREDVERTVFTVGDEKQSIYSFQRAAPEEFSRMRTYMAEKIQAAGKALENVDLNISFRSTESILKLVDEVFSRPEIAKGLGLDPIEHHSYRRGQAGLVELWPLFESETAEKRDPWTPPVEIIETKSGAVKLADYIGTTIKGWLDSKEELLSKDRAIQPSDIMILVRTRTSFTEQLMRALKIRGIPVSGADRMVLNDQISVQDMLALASFALMPADDLTLACILKSPIIGWDEEQLYDLAIERKGTLWEALNKDKHIQIEKYLQSLIDKAGRSHPYEFFSTILHSPCPADKRSAMRAMQNRLGGDIRDPLNELLSAALQFETDNIASLQGFLHWQGQGQAVIKREMEEAGGQVRIMTVHGAKGLQAPIVILPDTTRTSRHVPGQAGRRLLWPEKSDLDVPLWSPRKETDCGAFKEAFEHLQDKSDEEYRRLFYVAMTRAEDRLYIGGHKGAREPLEDCWYHYARIALENSNETEKGEDGNVRLTNPQIREIDSKKKLTDLKAPVEALPDWVYKPAPEEPDPPALLRPSRPSEAESPALSPLEAGKGQRFLRGNITHKLLQFLPGLPADKRLEAAQDYVRQHRELTDNISNSIVQETLAILKDKTYEDLFKPGSMAEVPMTGFLPDDRLISGQIDRLVITDTTVLVIDYKTNRPPPIREQDVPQIYRSQMQAYHDTLKEIYPKHEIKCALLWTDGPVLMPLDLTSRPLAP